MKEAKGKRKGWKKKVVICDERGHKRCCGSSWDTRGGKLGLPLTAHEILKKKWEDG